MPARRQAHTIVGGRIGAKRIAPFHCGASTPGNALQRRALGKKGPATFGSPENQPFSSLWRIKSGHKAGPDEPQMMENRMKIVRIASMAIALCVASASLAAAQGRPDSAPPRRGPMGGRLLDGITLSDAQQAQMKVIREKYMPKMTELRQAAMATGA